MEANVFILNPAHLPLLKRKPGYYETTSGNTLVSILIGCVVLAVGCGVGIGNILATDTAQAGLSIKADHVGLVLFLAGASIVLSGIFGFVLWMKRCRAQLDKKTRIIVGELLSGSLSFVPTRYWTQYILEINARFLSPSGHILDATGKLRRDDIHHEDFLPTIGTPVAILYLDDKHFQIL